MLVKHYLEQGLTKMAIAERVGVSRRTLHHWLATERLDREAEGPVRYPPRPMELDYPGSSCWAMSRAFHKRWGAAT